MSTDFRSLERWLDAVSNPPPTEKPVRVLYADGMECAAKRVGGNIYYPVGETVYRYVSVIKWRPL